MMLGRKSEDSFKGLVIGVDIDQLGCVSLEPNILEYKGFPGREQAWVSTGATHENAQLLGSGYDEKYTFS
jgi:hypothetical protein